MFGLKLHDLCRISIRSVDISIQDGYFLAHTDLSFSAGPNLFSSNVSHGL